MRNQAGSGCPCQCQQKLATCSTLRSEPGDGLGGSREEAGPWPTLGHQEQPAPPCPRPKPTQPQVLDPRSKHDSFIQVQPHPSSGVGVQHRPYSYSGLSQQVTQSFQKPKDSEMPDPNPFYSLLMVRGPRPWNKKPWAPQRPLWLGPGAHFILGFRGIEWVLKVTRSSSPDSWWTVPSLYYRALSPFPRAQAHAQPPSSVL